MSASVHVLPFVEGRIAVQARGIYMRTLAKRLGFVGASAAMDESECESLVRLDKLVSELSTMLHGFELAMERDWVNHEDTKPDRWLVNTLRTEITNYQQARLNELL